MSKTDTTNLNSFIRKPTELEENESLEFQALAWESGDFKLEDDNTETFHIFAMGVDQRGRSVCLDITDFTPFFYVKVPFNWTKEDANKLKYKVQRKMYYNQKHLISCKLMSKKDVDGFNNGKLFKFVRFVFDNDNACRRAQWMFKNPIEGFEQVKFRLYDVKSGPMLTFSYLRDILFCGWVKVEQKKLKEVSEDLSRCQLVYSTCWKNISPIEKDTNSPAVTLSYDIESYSFNGDFPDPDIPENIITQIGSGFCRLNSKEILKHIIVLGDCDPVPGAILEVVNTEEELITKWVELVEKTDPDLIIGYNIDDFDWKYIWKRAELLDITNVVARLTRLNIIPSEFQDDTLESNAYGMNYFRYIKTPGINQLDLLHWFRKNKKLDSYSLDNVSKEFLNNKKHPVTPQQIFDMSGPNGTPEGRSIVAAYCCHDTFLPIKLLEMFCMFVNLIEMAKVTRVPLMFLVLRGETIKVHSQIAYTARKQNYLIPKADKKGDVPFKGATVLKPKYGAYTNPVSGLDFASLYPSIMIAKNLCPTTFVKNSKYDNIEGIEYEHHQWEGGNYKFVTNKKGLVPGILSFLWSERKKVKKEMGAAFFKSKTLKKEAEALPDGEEKQKLLEESEKWAVLGSVLNGKQLAIKVSMNSIYGAFGATTFSIPCKPISSTVTFTGRQMIDHSKSCAEKWYDGSEKCGGIKAEVIYGDTDSIYTVFTLPGQDKMTKEEVLRKIWDVASECADRISETFQKPIELENEKTMWPLYLYGKKRYANLYYEEQKDGTFSCKKDFKGIQVVRRDNCQYVKSVCNPIFDKLLYDQDIDGAKNIARKMIKNLLNNEVDLEELILSKSLKSKYKEVNKAGNKLSKPAHWFLAQKLKERDSGTAPKAGDRVPYIFIENPKAKLQADKVEDPEYIKENPNKCKPDVLYYLDKQLASPLYTIFEVIVTDPQTKKVFPRKVMNDGSEKISKECKKEIARLLWDRSRQNKVNDMNGNQDITKWFKPAVKKKSRMVEEE